MFVREKKMKGKTSSLIQIVENQRVGNTTKQRVLRHIGTGHTPEKIGELKRIAEVTKTQLENKTIAAEGGQAKPQFAKHAGVVTRISKSTQIDVSQLREKARHILGIHDIYGYLYNQLGFTNLFTRPRQREAAATLLREMVLARIANPVSKRASVEFLEEQFGVTLDLDAVYHMMDKMDDAFYERIQQRALDETLKLTGEKLRVLFYDATTLYFESFTEDELKQNGYSKDMKFNQSQVLLALFVTEKGLPVGYELFPGATFEGHTLIPVLEKLKDRYQLDEVIFVADRGLLSEDNLTYLEENKFKYIVGARIKNLSKKLERDILNSSHYKTIDIKFKSVKKSREKPVQRMARFSHKGRELIVHYNSQRARKDEYDRMKALEKLTQKLAKSKDPKSLLNNYGYKKFIDFTGESTMSVNQEKVKTAAQWDGLLGVVTNMKDADPEQLLVYYRSLWQVEESFRINKHDLKMRPIYHWKPHRVRSHIAISFIAFVCVRYLEYLVSARSEKISPEVIRKALLRTQASIIEDKQSGKTFLLSSPISPVAKTIYRIIGIKIPPVTSAIRCGA